MSKESDKIRNREQVECIMDWAIGEKELKYYPDGEHCCANYFDEVIPYSIDWLRKTSVAIVADIT